MVLHWTLLFWAYVAVLFAHLPKSCWDWYFENLWWILKVNNDWCVAGERNRWHFCFLTHAHCLCAAITTRYISTLCVKRSFMNRLLQFAVMCTALGYISYSLISRTKICGGVLGAKYFNCDVGYRGS